MTGLIAALAVLLLQGPAGSDSRVVIVSNPGTRVTWDGVALGETDATGVLLIDHAPHGAFELELAKTGYETQRFAVVLDRPQHTFERRLRAEASPPPKVSQAPSPVKPPALRSADRPPEVVIRSTLRERAASDAPVQEVRPGVKRASPKVVAPAITVPAPAPPAPIEDEPEEPRVEGPSSSRSVPPLWPWLALALAAVGGLAWQRHRGSIKRRRRRSRSKSRSKSRSRSKSESGGAPRAAVPPSDPRQEEESSGNVLEELQQRERAMKRAGEGEIVEAEFVEIVEES